MPSWAKTRGDGSPPIELRVIGGLKGKGDAHSVRVAGMKKVLVSLEENCGESHRVGPRKDLATSIRVGAM